MPEGGRRESLRRLLFESVVPLLYLEGWGAAVAYRLGLNGSVDVERFEVALAARVPEPSPPMRIVFASDFHAGPTTDPRLIAGACDAMEREGPDLLLLGGDMASFRADYVEPLAERLGAIEAPLGRLAVLGNHDLRTDVGSLVERLERRGIQVLVNEAVQLPAPWEAAWVCGFDDARRGRPDAARAFAGAHGTRIVLAHSPSTLVEIGDERFELMLCGHTHGGQITLPGGRALYLPPGPYNRAYASGRFRVGPGGRATLLVSRGIGCSTLPIRVGARANFFVCDVGFVPGVV